MSNLVSVTHINGIGEVEIEAPFTIRGGTSTGKIKNGSKGCKCNGCSDNISAGEQYFRLPQGNYCLGCVKFD